MGCTIDSGCVEKPMGGLVEVYAFQVLKNPDLKSGELLVETAPMYLSSVKSRRLTSLWTTGSSSSALCTEAAGTNDIVSVLIALRLLSVQLSAESTMH